MNQLYRKLALPALLAVATLSPVLSAQTEATSAPTAGSATAQPAAPATTPDHHRDRAHRRFGPLQRLGFRREVAEKLGLTAEQKSQIQAARQSAREQLRTIRADTSLTPEEKKARIRTLVDNTRQQMKQVLTAEQQQRFEQLRAERRAARGQAQTTPNP